jgi:hypothetical protein
MRNPNFFFLGESWEEDLDAWEVDDDVVVGFVFFLFFLFLFESESFFARTDVLRVKILELSPSLLIEATPAGDGGVVRLVLVLATKGFLKR